MAEEATLPTDEGRKRVQVIYSRLESLWHGLESGIGGNTIEGPLTQYKGTLAELGQLTGNDYNSFMPHTWQNKEDNLECLTKDLSAQISNLMGELRPEYMPAQVPHFIKDTQSIALSISQHVNQEVSVTQSLVLNVAMKLEKLEDSYPVESPERNFISKLKEKLSTVKDVSSLITLIVTAAQSANISLNELHNILKALNLAG